MDALNSQLAVDFNSMSMSEPGLDSKRSSEPVRWDFSPPVPLFISNATGGIPLRYQARDSA